MAVSVSGSGNPGGATPGSGSPPPMPRWVKVFGTIMLALVLAFVLLHLTGHGLGGPGSHGGHRPRPASSEGPR